MTESHPFSIGTRVTFDVEDLVGGRAIIAEAEYDDGWLYRLDAVELMRGDAPLLARLVNVESDGSAWLCEHEVRPLAVGDAA
jgi:hypothetical protein